MKRIIKLIVELFVAGFAMYIVYAGIESGEILGRAATYRVEENPFGYYLALGARITPLTLWIVFAIWRIFDMLDSKVKEFGGNYNLNTFRAIFRSVRKNN